MNVDLLSNIVFGITGGLLTVVGLIAIFITLNTQHNVEKAREVLWDLQKFRYKYVEATEETADELSWLVSHYRTLIQPNSINKITIYIAIVTLAFVIALWGGFIVWLSPELSLAEFDISWIAIVGSFAIFAFFIWLLFQLINVRTIGKLPSVENFEDADFDIGNSTKMIELYALSARMTLNSSSYKADRILDRIGIFHQEFTNNIVSMQVLLHKNFKEEIDLGTIDEPKRYETIKNLGLDLSDAHHIEVNVNYKLEDGMIYSAKYLLSDLEEKPYISYTLLPGYVSADSELTNARLQEFLNETEFEYIKKNWRDLIRFTLKYTAIFLVIFVACFGSYRFGINRVVDTYYKKTEAIIPSLENFVRNNVLVTEPEANFIVREVDEKLYRVYVDGGDEFLIKIGKVTPQDIEIKAVLDMWEREIGE